MLRSHSAAVGAVSVSVSVSVSASASASASASSFTLMGLEVEQCGWVELELEPSGLEGL